MPLSEKQLAIHAFPYSKYKHLICDGSVRSGKSINMIVSFITWAMREFNHQNFIILGFTIGSVLRNVVDPLLAMAYMKRRYKMQYSSSRSVLIVEKDGKRNQFMIFGADSKRAFEKIQGLTAAGCLIDEVAICDQQAVNMALSRCSVTGSRYWFNCNPDNPNHWFYKDWILNAESHSALHLHFTMDDNPSLSDEVKERYNLQFHGVFHDRYVKGLWVVAEGLVYQFDNQDEYTCTEKEAEGAGEWYISIDYGITNPFAALLWRVTKRNAYIVDEYYFASKEQNRRKTDSEHYLSVEKLAEGHNIEAIIIDPSANSFKEEIWRKGKFDVQDADNSVLEGIQVTDQMLHDGSVKISEKCENTIAEMGLYRWDDSKLKDEVIKENDHAMDAMRYLCNTVLKYELQGYDW